MEPTQVEPIMLYKKEWMGEVCTKRKVKRYPDKKSYKGTLKGGLQLEDDSGERKHTAVVGVVDKLGNDDVKMDAMISEHSEKPKHYGIKVSALETLVPADRVKEQRRDMSIIFHMFD